MKNKTINKQKEVKSLGKALLGFAEIGKKLKLKGPKDLSINHDKYLYS